MKVSKKIFYLILKKETLVSTHTLQTRCDTSYSGDLAECRHGPKQYTGDLGFIFNG